MADNAAANVRVCCRFRPQNRIEDSHGGRVIVRIDPEHDSLTFGRDDQAQRFNFDYVFDSTATQRQVFENSARPIVDAVLKGYNGTIFAYGQTSSGKTFTMEGPDIDDAELKGLIPRIVEALFDGIMSAPETVEFTVKVSYFEIYLEKIRDLLNPHENNLNIREEKGRGIYVQGLAEVYVGSAAEVLGVMKQGAANRKVAATNMNEYSSRSHSLFMLTINQNNSADLSHVSSKLYLVDLAGSEKIAKTGAQGLTLDEAKNINKSLSALGMVINALTDGKSTHVPYRDSKLTRVLQESLGGNARTALVINCSPSSYNEDETISTLRFGTRAKSITNKAKINAEKSVGELKLLVVEQEKEIAHLKLTIATLEEELSVARGGAPTQGSAGGGKPGLTPTAMVLQERIEKLEAEREALTSLIDAAQSHVEERERAIAPQAEELKTLKAEREQILSQLEAARQQTQVLERQVEQSQIDMQKLKFEQKEKLLAAENLESANQRLQQQLMALQAGADPSAAAKQGQMAELMSARGPLGSGILAEREQAVRRQLGETLEKMDAMGHRDSWRMSGSQTNVADMVALQAAHDTAVAEAKELREQLTALHSSFDTLQSSNATLGSNYNATVAARDALKAEQESLKALVSTANAGRDKVQAAHDALVTRVEALQAAQTMLTSEHGAQKAAHETLLTSHNGLKETNSALQTRYEALVTEHSTLASNNAALQTEASVAKSRLTATQGDLDQLKAAHAAIVAEQASTLSRLSTLQATHDGLQTAHQQLQTRFDASQTSLESMTTSSKSLKSSQDALAAIHTATAARLEFVEKQMASTDLERVKAQHELNNVRQLLTEAEAQTEQLRTKYDAAMTSRDKLNSARVAAQKEADALKASNASLQAAHDSLKTRLETAQAATQTLQAAHDELQAAHNAAKSKCEELQTALSAATAANESTTASRDALQASLDQLRDGIAKQAAEIEEAQSTAQKEKSQLGEEVEVVSREAGTLRLQLAELNVAAAAQREAQRVEGEALRAQLATSNNEKDSLRASRDSLQTQLAESQRATTATAAERDNLRGKLDTLQAKLAGKLSEVETLTRDLAAVNGELASITTERDGLKTERDALHSKLTVANQELTTLRNERDGLRSSTTEGAAELSRVGGERDTARAEVASLQAQLTTATTDLAAARKEIEDRDGKVAALTGDVTAARGQGEQITARLNETLRERDAALARATAVSEELAASEAACAALRKEKDAVTEERNGLNARVESIGGELWVAQMEKESNATAAATLASERDILVNEKTTLAGELQRVTASLQTTSDERAKLEADLVARTEQWHRTSAEMAALVEAHAVALEAAQTEGQRPLREALEQTKKELEKERARVTAAEERAAAQQVKFEESLHILKDETQGQLSKLDELKTQLEQDLIDRCETVIELKMDMDNQRDQWTRLMSADKRELAKKIAQLEKQVTTLTKGLADEVSMTKAAEARESTKERQMGLQREHITAMEAIVTNLQEKLRSEAARHEKEMIAFRADMAESMLASGNSSPRNSVSVVKVGNNIAKPIRGGGGLVKSRTDSTGSSPPAAAPTTAPHHTATPDGMGFLDDDHEGAGHGPLGATPPTTPAMPTHGVVVGAVVTPTPAPVARGPPRSSAPDETAVRCFKCGSEFGLLQRRQKCGWCEETFCSNCTQQKADMPERGYDVPQRVCNTCAIILSETPMGPPAPQAAPAAKSTPEPPKKGGFFSFLSPGGKKDTSPAPKPDDRERRASDAGVKRAAAAPAKVNSSPAAGPAPAPGGSWVVASPTTAPTGSPAMAPTASPATAATARSAALVNFPPAKTTPVARTRRESSSSEGSVEALHEYSQNPLGMGP